MADVALPVELHALIREGSDLLDLALCLLDLAVELGADLVELRPHVVHLAIQRPQRAMEAVEPFVGIVGEVRGDGGREEHQGVEGEHADRQERDQRPVKDSWEDDHRIPPQLRRAHLVGLGDRPDAALELVELPLVRLDDRPKLGDPARGGLEDLLHGLLTIRDQRLLEWSGRVGAHLRNVALAVLLPFGGDAALVREFRQRWRLALRERDMHDRYASCFLRTELSSSIRNLTLSSTVSSVEERSVMRFMTAW